jgi:NAD(P)H-dependent FMN reductase
MRMMIICGSLHRASGTRTALAIAGEALECAGVEVDFYDLGTHRFPLYDPDLDDDPEVVADFRQRAHLADGFIIGTPEYHNGMSGALKNALDYLGSREFRGKPVGLLACAGGGKGGINAINNLRTVIRGVMGLAIAEQAVVDEDDFDVAMNLTNTERRNRVVALANAVRRYVRLLELEKAGAL